MEDMRHSPSEYERTKQAHDDCEHAELPCNKECEDVTNSVRDKLHTAFSIVLRHATASEASAVYKRFMDRNNLERSAFESMSSDAKRAQQHVEESITTLKSHVRDDFLETEEMRVFEHLCSVATIALITIERTAEKAFVFLEQVEAESRQLLPSSESNLRKFFPRA
jgi:hypothetical protein